ncbi:hypothetical protein FACS189472_07030 [Alphaproteobacteria bacterium]|nr:hypothetical protein FACS189472_07030 [Alphaproteobacteria bacterium]
MTLQGFLGKYITDKIQLQLLMKMEHNLRTKGISLNIAHVISLKTFLELKEITYICQINDKRGCNSFIYCADRSSDDMCKVWSICSRTFLKLVL